MPELRQFDRGKIDDAKLAAEGNSRLGSPFGQTVEPGSAPARKDESHGLPGQATDESGLVQGLRHGTLNIW